jgi:PAS domain S-box-containing protein
MKSIKTKISGGFVFLFLVILILSIAGIVFVNQLSEGSKGTIKDNYASVQYAFEMLNSSENIFQLAANANYSEPSFISQYESEKAKFNNNLKLQANNITENGEAELVKELKTEYSKFVGISDSIVYKKLKNDRLINNFSHSYIALKNTISKTYNLNMEAVLRRNNTAENTADRAIIIMGIVGILSIIITLSFIFTFPGKIINPLKELTSKIKEISERHYDQKLSVNSDDELGALAKAFNTMAVRLKEYEESTLDNLLFEKKRMDAVIQNLQDGVLIVDENMKIIRINKTALALSGLKEEDVVNKSVSEVAKRNDLIKEITKTLSIQNKESEQPEKPIKIIQEGKEQFFSIENYEIFMNHINDKKESKIGNVIFLRNITSFQQRDAAKTNLIATASHEFKTPLSSINLSLKLLGDIRMGDLNDEQKKLVNSIRTQSNRLSKVVNELLDYSQAETGNIRLKLTEVKPEDVVDLTVTALMMLVSEKNIQLESKIDENLPSIQADLEKTVWVLVNLLSNAIRYSPQNGVINVDAKLADGMVTFSVEDNGPGIAEDELPKVFDKFAQVGKLKKGTGLGLAISKEFVQSQGGKIWVESEPGKGSKFSFSMPIYL